MIRVKFGQKYTGPGSADPKKTREEREAELRRRIASDDGRTVIELLYREAQGTPIEVRLPAGISFGWMIRKILDKEYSQG
jgi:hypothetical protein